MSYGAERPIHRDASISYPSCSLKIMIYLLQVGPLFHRELCKRYEEAGLSQLLPINQSVFSLSWMCWAGGT